MVAYTYKLFVIPTVNFHVQNTKKRRTKKNQNYIWLLT